MPSVTEAIKRDPGREAVEPIDPVDRVDHPDDPEDREPDRERLAEADRRPVAERVVDDRDADPERDGDQGQPDLAGQLPARAQVEQVVDAAERGRRGTAEEQGQEVRGLEGQRRRHPAEPLVEQDEPAGDQQEGRSDREAAGPRDRAAC